jgi:HAD superfamily hydrolase (TIGR01509 family)
MLENTGQLKYLDILVSNEDASPNKPSPHPYNVAMSRLGLRPENVLIVEDSNKGIESALGTGAHVMRVKNATEVTCSSMFDSGSCSISRSRIIT